MRHLSDFQTMCLSLKLFIKILCFKKEDAFLQAMSKIGKNPPSSEKIIRFGYHHYSRAAMMIAAHLKLMTLNLTRQKSLLDRFTASVIRQNDLKHVKLRDTE